MARVKARKDRIVQHSRDGVTQWLHGLASGRQALLSKMPMQRVGRAREAGEMQGFMKVLVDAENQRILGAAILGMNGDEVVHCLLDLMAADQPYTLYRLLAGGSYSPDGIETSASASSEIATDAGAFVNCWPGLAGFAEGSCGHWRGACLLTGLCALR
jgi:hypothetical protein